VLLKKQNLCQIYWYPLNHSAGADEPNGVLTQIKLMKLFTSVSVTACLPDDSESDDEFASYLLFSYF
jgi:hypothetical protein